MGILVLTSSAAHRADRTIVNTARVVEAAKPRDVQVLAGVSLLAFLLVIAAIVASDLMLYGDGSWFVFALATGSPWAIKWHFISARFTTYALTVVPTGLVAQNFGLSPHQIVPLNALFFYGAQFALYAASLWSAARFNAQYVVYPLLLFVSITFTALGFPSEILLSPGLMWIALFETARAKRLTLLSWLAYLGLVFSHELAIPAAVVIAALAVTYDRRKGRSAVSRLATLALLVAPILLFLVVRHLGGGEGSNNNAIFAIDPRRVLANPSLWIVAAAALGLIRFGRPENKYLAGALIFAAALAVPLLHTAFPDLVFMRSRYDVRSIIALSMFAFAIVFVRSELVTAAAAAPKRNTVQRFPLDNSILPMFVAIALAVQMGAFAVFVNDWRAALAGEQQAQIARGSVGKYPVLTASQARMAMDERGRYASNQAGFDWSMPYRAFILADGAKPLVVFYDPNYWYKRHCDLRGSMIARGSRFSPGVLHDWLAHACQPVDRPVKNTISNRLKKKFMDWWTAI